jgi:Tfp pilus assembly protein PilN
MKNPHLINLLPKSATRAFMREYQFRVLTLGVFILIFIVVINILLLVPTYLYAHTHVRTLQTKLDGLNQFMKTNDHSQLATRVATLSKEQVYLQQLQKSPKASALFDAILKVPRRGTSLTGFSLTLPVGTIPGKMMITGTAATREDLRAYTAALGTLPFVTSVDLPISAYASESNIAFTITLTGSFML